MAVILPTRNQFCHEHAMGVKSFGDENGGRPTRIASQYLYWTAFIPLPRHWGLSNKNTEMRESYSKFDKLRKAQMFYELAESS